jgi:hypothetical protein
MTTLKKWIDMKIKDGDIDYFEYNKFSNIEEISKGGFGIVKSACWNIDALKSLLNDLTIDENQKENFLKEVI